MAEVTIRDLEPSDYPDLDEMLDRQWRFSAYSKEKGLAIARSYLLHCVDGSNEARTILVDGRPAGIVVMRDMPGKIIDLSDELEEQMKDLVDLPLMPRYEEDMDKLYGAYRTFAKDHKKKEWAELRLLLISDRFRGHGLGRESIKECERILKKYGMTGMFFFTDTDCDFAFYDHIGCCRVGSTSIICTGEPLDVFGYYYVMKA